MSITSIHIQISTHLLSANTFLLTKKKTGTSSDCKFDSNYKVSGQGCNNYVLIIQDKEAYPDDSDVQTLSPMNPNVNDLYLNIENGYYMNNNNENETPQKSGWKYVPDVFLSGAVHGNERVGPTSLVEMSELLLESAHCESLPRMRYSPNGGTANNGNEEEMWENELMEAKKCRESLSNKGIPSPYRQWLARLVSTRRTVVIPTANALGYARNEREESGIDPNRDFPFDIKPSNSNDCMQTVAGRSINELFRSHLFPIGLTFHGGMEVIGYEWGAPTYLNKDAPGAIAQRTIASAYSRYANGFEGHRPYDFGTMNDKVYYVRGGMEDWAFAGSWDPDRVVTCTPTTFGGYPPDKTRYNNSTLRAFNMLIETSDPKEPSRSELGTRNDPLISSNNKNNGHVARNIRLALLAIDVVEPYVTIRGVEGLELSDDVVSGVNMRMYNGASYLENSKMIWIPPGDSPGKGSNMKEVTISWTVGGAFVIDKTELVVGPWDGLPTNLANVDDGTYPSVETIKLMNSNAFTKSESTQGRSRWHDDGPHPTASESDINPTFEATIDVSTYPPGTKLAVFAKARVDKDWLQPTSNVAPNTGGPVSHIVNSRRNPAYYAANAGKVIRGRVDDYWYSDPITIVIGGVNSENQLLQDAIASNAPKSVDGDHIKAVHINARLGYIPSVMESVSNEEAELEDAERVTATRDTPNQISSTSSLSMTWLLGTLCIAMILVLVLVALVRRRRQHRRRDFIARVAQEEDSFSVGSYRDDAETGVEMANEEDDDEVAQEFTID